MFTQKISMSCTEEQYTKYLKDELLKMGYIESCLAYSLKASYITNNFRGQLGTITNLIQNDVKNYGRTYLDSFNPELFLALASMTNNPEGNYGEYWVFQDEACWPMWINGKLYKQMGNLNDGEAFIDDTGCPNGMHPDNFDYFRKATAEEIMEHFKPKEEELIPEKENIIIANVKILSVNGYLYLME